MRVRSKQSVRDKVGPLKDNVGNIITLGFLRAEELNVYNILCTSVQCSQEKILVRYLHQKQSSKGWGRKLT